MEITAEMIEQARLRGACKSALRQIKPGDSVELLDSETLQWIDNSGMWTIDTCVEIVGSAAVLVCGLIPAALFSGYGHGYGCGDGHGYGCGYGDGYGDGYGHGYGYGDGYGHGCGYGDGYGYGCGNGDGCGDGCHERRE